MSWTWVAPPVSFRVLVREALAKSPTGDLCSARGFGLCSTCGRSCCRTCVHHQPRFRRQMPHTTPLPPAYRFLYNNSCTGALSAVAMEPLAGHFRHPAAIPNCSIQDDGIVGIQDRCARPVLLTHVGALLAAEQRPLCGDVIRRSCVRVCLRASMVCVGFGVCWRSRCGERQRYQGPQTQRALPEGVGSPSRQWVLLPKLSPPLFAPLESRGLPPGQWHEQGAVCELLSREQVPV